MGEKMSQDTPFLISTSTLRFTNKQPINTSSSSSSTITSLQKETTIRVPLPDLLIQKPQLDYETRDKLSRLIHEKKEKYKYRRGGGKNNRDDDSIFEGGDFTFFTSVRETLGLRTHPILDVITLDMLIHAKIIIKDLIETDDGISIATLKAAGIINTFEDLQALRFDIMDLVRNRNLFSVNTLVMLFNTNFKDLYKTKKSFTIKDLQQCHFWACELNTLKFSIEPFINEEKVTKRELFSLSFKPMEWQSLGLKRSHLIKLKISHQEALKLPPNGFGWTEDEYQQFAHPNK